jgi:excisionase family DNA binding protein
MNKSKIKMARHDVPVLLDIEEAAAYLSVNVHFVRRLVAQRRVPYTKLGRLLRFDVRDLATFLEAGRVESSQP